MTMLIEFQSLGQVLELVTSTVVVLPPRLPRFLFGLPCGRIWMGAGGDKTAHVRMMGTQRSTKDQGPNNPLPGYLKSHDSLALGHDIRLPTPPPKHGRLLSKPFTQRGHVRSKL